MRRFGLAPATSLLLVALTGAPAEARDIAESFTGNVRELQTPIHIQAKPRWKSSCVLRQSAGTTGESPPQQFVTFETYIEGAPEAAVIVQTVTGHEESVESPALFGYQHRVTLGPSGLPVETEARAIDGFPISKRDLRQAALDGKVDIRDSIFSGRTFGQGDLVNRRAEETFRLLKPVLPRNLSMDTMVDHSDESRLIGLVESEQGRPTLLFRLDIDSTNVRRSSATNTVLRGHLFVDVESGLLAGEDWSAQIDRTSENPFEIVTKVDCSIAPVD